MDAAALQRIIEYNRSVAADMPSDPEILPDILELNYRLKNLERDFKAHIEGKPRWRKALRKLLRRR